MGCCCGRRRGVGGGLGSFATKCWQWQPTSLALDERGRERVGERQKYQLSMAREWPIERREWDEMRWASFHYIHIRSWLTFEVLMGLHLMCSLCGSHTQRRRGGPGHGLGRCNYLWTRARLRDTEREKDIKIERERESRVNECEWNLQLLKFGMNEYNAHPAHLQSPLYPCIVPNSDADAPQPAEAYLRVHNSSPWGQHKTLRQILRFNARMGPCIAAVCLKYFIIP